MRDEAAILLDLGLNSRFRNNIWWTANGDVIETESKIEIMGRRAVKRLTFVRGTNMEGTPENRSELPMFEPKEMTINEVALKASEDILSALPNDLTQLIYLASIRDYNSGTYRHPVLSRQFDATIAHQAFEIRHRQIFARMLAIPICKYVEQLEGYIRYSRAERDIFIATWNSLQAYRAAIPLEATRRACETFFLNVTTALAILELPNEPKI